MKQDRMGRAVEMAALRLGRMIDLVEAAIPLGPDMVEMGRGELKRRLRKAPGEVLAQMLDTLGPEIVKEILEERSGREEEAAEPYGPGSAGSPDAGGG